jgi:hypothetical protein
VSDWGAAVVVLMRVDPFLGCVDWAHRTICTHPSPLYRQAARDGLGHLVHPGHTGHIVDTAEYVYNKESGDYSWYVQDQERE